ncbi:hypothetical protein [Limoniibacter endophyticus]|uniref:Uncharacterized protein n=1 Tax=Limoniibacter endophyticus TaxID=1565040 RepID=A0A8J3DNC9_9HYPH|nr:hypothetical protein [Limoniibacter endophyticus]GHC65981.1 hypothetical protein GCM10010136_09070 [Limoniibacter endophyticus]
MAGHANGFHTLSAEEIYAIMHMSACIVPVRHIPGVDQFTIDTLMMRGLVKSEMDRRWKDLSYSLTQEGQRASHYFRIHPVTEGLHSVSNDASLS